MKAYTVRGARAPHQSSSDGSSWLGSAALVLACAGAVAGCSSDEQDAVVAGDTGEVRALMEQLDVPTTVAVSKGRAYVPEGQLDHFLGVDTAPPAPFRVVSVSLEDNALGPEIDLPGDDAYPEGIASAPDGTLYVGSVATGKIWRVAPDSTEVTEFVADGVLQRGALGMKVDEKRGMLWVCDSNPAGPPGGTIVGITLADGGAAAVRHEMAANSLCNDIVVDARGTLWATDSFGGSIYRVPSAVAGSSAAASLWLSHPLLTPPAGAFGANGIALAGERLFVSVTYSGILARIDPSSDEPEDGIEAVTLIERGKSGSLTLAGPDGVDALSDTELLVVENGFAGDGSKRLLKVTLDPE
jgi:sugar lactone lactonase YvrE